MGARSGPRSQLQETLGRAVERRGRAHFGKHGVFPKVNAARLP